MAAMLLLGLVNLAACSRDPITPGLEATMTQQAPGAEMRVIVTFTDKVNPNLVQGENKALRQASLIAAMKTNASVAQAGLRRFLTGRGVRDVKDLWIINGAALAATPDTIREMANLAGVESIRPDYVLQAPVVTYGVSGTPGWNLNLIHVPELWALGYDGTGIVIAGMDSGVDIAHPDLAGRWRGGTNSWFDPHGQHATPYDATGHGTQVMGLMVGGNASGSAVGIAPGARWIAVKIFNDADQTFISNIHQSFQWLLDPDGNPATSDTPDLVNASWGLPGNLNQCDPEFGTDIQTLKAAGIGMVFAGGNDGPASQTSVSPANNAGAFPVGAVDNTSTIANFSGRGPSACDGGIYPKISAPGVSVNTTDLSLGGNAFYTYVSGTSYAAPHVTGVMALLLQAFPGMSVSAMETALTQSAQDLGAAGADNDYGHGLVNALAAYNFVRNSNQSPVAVSDTVSISQRVSRKVSFTAIPVLANDYDPDGALDPSSVVIVSRPSQGGTAIANADGTVSYTPKLYFTGTETFTYTVKDLQGRVSNVANVNIDVVN